MLISISHIGHDLVNPRRIKTPPESDAALLRSIQTLGLLQPVLVVRNGAEGHWNLLAGRRRLAAVAALGLTEITAEDVTDRIDPDEDTGLAIGAAENMVRAPMHPVDQWRAISDLSASSGYSIETAAAALGVNAALARRMAHLGKMAPDLLDAIGAGDLPEVRYLRIIAAAPHAMQIAALEQGRSEDRVYWSRVAEACTMRRIPMSRAIFDTALLAWDEDLFAEPDDPDRFTTSEIDEFLELQTKSIAAEVLKMKGRYLLEPDRGAAERNQMPKGWIKSFETIPKRWRKDDPRKVFVCLHRDGYHIGRVDYLLAEPDAEPDVGSRASGIARLPNGSKPARPDISKKVQARIAELKAETMRDRLDVFQRNGTGDMLHTLLLTFACNNVHRIPHDIGAKLVLSDGEPAPVSDEDLCELATAVIARIVKFDRPDFYNASGPAAEWIARRIGVEMPRMDTDEILKGLSGDRLRALAAEHKIAGHGTLSEVRKRLAGNLPDWRPVAFGAHGPGLSDDDDEPDIGDNDAPDVDDDRIEEDAENGDDPDEEYPDNGPTDPWRTSRDDVA